MKTCRTFSSFFGQQISEQTLLDPCTVYVSTGPGRHWGLVFQSSLKMPLLPSPSRMTALPRNGCLNCCRTWGWNHSSSSPRLAQEGVEEEEEEVEVGLWWPLQLLHNNELGFLAAAIFFPYIFIFSPNTNNTYVLEQEVPNWVWFA